MGTHKIHADLDVDGEVKGTSLDINGNADISGTLNVTGAITNAGNTTITLGAPQLILKDSTDDDDHKIIFRNNADVDDYLIQSKDFTSAATGDGLFIGSANADKVALVTNDTTALTLDTSQNATFAGDITVGANHIGRDADNYIDFATDNTIGFRVNANSELKLDAFQLYPSTSDGLKLGHASYQWSDLFLASGAVVNFNNGDVTMTHSSNTLTIAGGQLTVSGEIEGDSLDINGNADISGNITSAGWTGDVIASAYLDSDTMHLSVLQNITAHKEFQDNIQLRFGNDQDLRIQHTGSHGYIDNETGNFYIRAEADDSHIYIQADNGSGSNATYIDVDGSSEKVTFSKAIHMPDYIYHVGDTNTYFGFSGADTYKVFTGGAERLQINSSGITTSQNITASNIIVDDDGQIGSASEPGAMEIADDGTVSFNGGLSVSGSIKSTIKNRVAAISGGTDADHRMGDVAYFGSTTSMDAGKIYYYTASGTWALIDADAASTSTGMIGVALGSASNTNGVLLRGFVTLDHDPGSVGNVLFLSTTAGTASSTAPSGSGDIVRVIGYCLHASNGAIYFNPDGTFVEVA